MFTYNLQSIITSIGGGFLTNEAALSRMVEGGSQFKANTNPAPSTNDSFALLFQDTNQEEELRGFSLIGLPIRDVVVIRPIGNEGLSLIDMPFITSNFIKRVVKTPIIGGDGTVKEVINNDDVAISIRGTICNLDNTSELPYNNITALRNMFYQNAVMVVESRYFEAINVTNIVIENLSIEPTEFPNTITYSIDCVSDVAFELQLK